MWKHLDDYQIILGSQSPRRVELLRGLDLPFEQIRLEGVDESYPTDLPLEEIPLYIARVKAEAYRPLLGERTLLITADTLVFIGDKVLGKPRDAAQAKAMLRELSGQKHTVTTGVVLMTPDRSVAFSDTATVEFLPWRMRRSTTTLLATSHWTRLAPTVYRSGSATVPSAVSRALSTR